MTWILVVVWLIGASIWFAILAEPMVDRVMLAVFWWLHAISWVLATLSDVFWWLWIKMGGK